MLTNYSYDYYEACALFLLKPAVGLEGREEDDEEESNAVNVKAACEIISATRRLERNEGEGTDPVST